MATYARLEIWSPGIAVFAMARLVVVGKVLRCEESEDLASGSTLEFDTPLDDQCVTHLVERRIVRLVFSDDTYLERRISKVRGLRGEQGNTVTVTAQDPLLDMADGGPITEQLGSGVVVYDVGVIELTAEQILDNIILPALAASGKLYFEKGVVEPTQLISPSFTAQTPLAWLRGICDLCRDPETLRPAELRVRLNGTKYAIDILTEIGAVADDVELTDIRYRKNLRTTDRATDTAQQATSVTPLGEAFPDGSTSGIAHARWRLDLVSGTTYEISDPEGGPPPILEDDFLSYYVMPTDSPTASLVEIMSSSVGPPAIVNLATNTGITDGGLFELRHTFVGIEITSLTSPSNLVLYGGKHAMVSMPGVSAVTNEILNPWFRDWTTPTSPPNGWTSYDGLTFATYMSQNTDPLYTEYGGKSVLFETLDSTAGVLHGVVCPTFYPVAIEGGLYFSAKVWVFFKAFSGAAWFFLRIRKATGGDPIALLMLTAPDNTVEQRGSPTIGQWNPVTIYDMDLSPGNLDGIVVEVLAQAGYQSSVAGSLSFYLDATQCARHTGVPPEGFYEYSGANAIFSAGVRALRANGAPLTRYEVDTDDLTRFDGTAFPFDEFRLGATVNLTDAALTLSAEPVRIIGIPLRDYLAPKRTRLQLATRAELLAEYLNSPSFAPNRLTPTTTKPTPPPTQPPPTSGGTGATGARWEVRAVETTHTLTAMPAALTEIDTDLQRHVDILAFVGGCAVTGRVQP